MSCLYKFRETLPLDKWSGAHVDILVDQADHLTVRAVDLIGDAWHDHLHDLKLARDVSASDYARNRAIQSSLSKLMTHFDGVVSGVFKCLTETDPTFHMSAKKARYCTLLQKATALKTHYQQRTAARLPDLDLDFKHIRDLLIHPYIKKTRSSSDQPLNQGDIFDLTVDDLTRFSSAVNRWLGVLTDQFEYPRGYNTEVVAKDYCEAIYSRYRAGMPFKDEKLPRWEDVGPSTSRI